MSNLLHHIRIAETQSTNTLAAGYSPAEAPHGTVVSACAQTAGRGQRGNSWESEPGKNLTFSLVLRPQNWPANAQFDLSMAVSLAITESLETITGDDKIRIKWPNDIYHGDMKLAGILIENVFTEGRLSRAVVGIGLNVNQDRFLSDAPNPVSLLNITGMVHDTDVLLDDICTRIVRAMDVLDAAFVTQSDRGGYPDPTLLDRYLARMWRNDGHMYAWTDLRGDVPADFDARVGGIGRWGTLMLDRPARDVFCFKEVAAKL